MSKKDPIVIKKLQNSLIKIISETNGITLSETIELLLQSPHLENDLTIKKLVHEFYKLLAGFQQDEIDVDTLLNHPISDALFKFFKDFPLPYHEEHIHLTGSLSAEFIYPRLKPLIEGEHQEIYKEKITAVYGDDCWPINSIEDVANMIELKDGELFERYLKILYLPKLILTNKKAHIDAAFHMASTLFHDYNVGKIRLKFTLARGSSIESEIIPGIEAITEEDVLLGLYEGFSKFKNEQENFEFILSPCFRKEENFFDSKNYKTKSEHFDYQVDRILDLIEKYPFLKGVLSDIDTVGDEKELYRKVHFAQMKKGLRKLQYNGIKVRSHHGETWKTLRMGIQSVDNAMNIWHIDTLEHGLSLGLNPNYYFHRLYQRVMEQNKVKIPILENSHEYLELKDMDWHDPSVLRKLLKGEPISHDEEISFIKTKYHTAREIEHYQHDVLNRMINKKVSLVALPSSNLKLTGKFPDYKDHPFSWWEKKGVRLGVGTDNYITLKTNFIQEMMLLLFSDPYNLKITKLLIIATREKRRPYIGHLLWEMRKKALQQKSSEA